MLRAYADDELGAGERELVQQHVHQQACRDCAVALSRVEAEVYGLRGALRGAPVEVPPDFVAAVMARVRAEHDAAGAGPDLDADVDGDAVIGADLDASADIGVDVEPEVSRAAAPARAGANDADVSADFTPRVMERIRREWKRPSWRARTALFARRHAIATLVAGALVAAALLVWLRLGLQDDVPALRVMSAEGGTLLRGSRAANLAGGEALGAGDEVRVAASGRAVLLVPETDGSQRALLEVEGRTQFEVHGKPERVRQPLLRLVQGHLSVQVLGEDGLSVALHDGCRIDFESGSFSLFAEPAERHDGRLALYPKFTAVTLIAMQGSAYIARGRGQRTLVEPGFVALFDDWSGVMFERWLSDAELRATLSRRDLAQQDPTPAPAARPADWLGSVVSQQSNAGVANATVILRRRGSELIATTGIDGSFRLPGLGDVDGETAHVDVTLPEGAPGTVYGNVANFTGPLTLTDASKGAQRERRLAPIRLAPERPVLGKVADPQGRPLGGAKVSPVILDGIAGSARRLSPLVADAITAPDGSFVLRRLPAVLPPYLDVVLLVEHKNHGAIAALDLLAEPSVHDQALEITMVGRHQVSVSDLPAGQTVEILASIRNLAPAAMMQVSASTADASGTVELEVAEGASLWLRQGETLVALEARKDRPLAFQRVERKVPAQVAALAQQRTGRRGTVIERGRWRYDTLVAATGEPRTVALIDRQGHELAGARLFVLDKRDGSVAYLGEMTSSSALLPMPPGADYRVVAVTDDGAVGVADATELQENLLRVRVLSPGAAQLPAEVIAELIPAAEQSGGYLVFQLEMVEPLRDYVVHRHAGRDSGWELRGLIPGTYRFTSADGRTWQVRVPPGGRGEFGPRQPGQSGPR
jgi:hypothetical protein